MAGRAGDEAGRAGKVKAVLMKLRIAAPVCFRRPVRWDFVYGDWDRQAPFIAAPVHKGSRPTFSGEQQYRFHGASMPPPIIQSGSEARRSILRGAT